MKSIEERRLYKRPRSTREWCDYFRANASSTVVLPPNIRPEISVREREAIASSVQEFQLGESGEGKHLYQAAKDYAIESGDIDYIEAAVHLIKEEQRHAGYLKTFLTIEGIGVTRKTRLDRIFRRLRKLADLEVCICVLITAEIIAKVYYPALGKATGSTLLQRLCKRIEEEEIEHVIFQSERLAMIRRNRSKIGLKTVHALQKFLFIGTCLLVWRRHARAMKLGGFGFRSYWASCWNEFNNALSRMDPRNYENL